MSSTSQDQTTAGASCASATGSKFQEGPPHEVFRRLRCECPVHWSDGITEYPDEDGFWSVTKADDVHEVSRDWQTFSSEVGGFTATRKPACRWRCSRRCSSAWTRPSTTV